MFSFARSRKLHDQEKLAAIDRSMAIGVGALVGGRHQLPRLGVALASLVELNHRHLGAEARHRILFVSRKHLAATCRCRWKLTGK